MGAIGAWVWLSPVRAFSSKVGNCSSEASSSVRNFWEYCTSPDCSSAIFLRIPL
jgi:hypothetical protein